jgi:hypothetical protein
LFSTFTWSSSLPREIADLEGNAVKFWPTALSNQEKSTSIIPKLIETLDKFIGVLYVSDASPTAWKEVLRVTAGLPGNLFLKHLVVLSDVGGEKLQRYRGKLDAWFPEGEMSFRWRDRDHKYTFNNPTRPTTWTNSSLCIAGDDIVTAHQLSPAMEDVAMLLLHGGSATEPGLPDDLIEKCMIGSLIGRNNELDAYVRQRYIHVSRITGGATANAMGQLCQNYVLDYLSRKLSSWDFSNRSIPGISQNEGETDTAFDIVAKSPDGIYCAIEVSFQVTTNSTIERKAGQAQSRHDLLHQHGHRIAYVIDGAGNFQRVSALRTICNYSDCTVAFSDCELDELVRYLTINGKP